MSAERAANQQRRAGKGRRIYGGRRGEVTGEPGNANRKMQIKYNSQFSQSCFCVPSLINSHSAAVCRCSSFLGGANCSVSCFFFFFFLRGESAPAADHLFLLMECVHERAVQTPLCVRRDR